MGEEVVDQHGEGDGLSAFQLGSRFSTSGASLSNPFPFDTISSLTHTSCKSAQYPRRRPTPSR